MDLLAHALWAGAGAEALRRRGYLSSLGVKAAIALAIMPDLPQMVPLAWWAAFDGGTLRALYAYATAVPGGEPIVPAAVEIATHHLHCAPHSAFIAAVATVIAGLIRRSSLLPMLGWWSHIVIDVFTHSADYYAVPVLYPFSERAFDGVPWNTPAFLAVNYIAIAIAYAWLARTRPRRAV